MKRAGHPDSGTLKVNGKVVQTITMERTMPMILQWDESFDIGSDTLTGVNDADYQPPFRFTGKLIKVTLVIDRQKLSPTDFTGSARSGAQVSDGQEGDVMSYC